MCQGDREGTQWQTVVCVQSHSICTNRKIHTVRRNTALDTALDARRRKFKHSKTERDVCACVRVCGVEWRKRERESVCVCVWGGGTGHGTQLVHGSCIRIKNRASRASIGLRRGGIRHVQKRKGVNPFFA